MEEHLAPLLAYVRERIPLSDAEAALVVAHTRITSAPRRTPVVPFGDTRRLHHFVLKGCLRTYYLDPQGNESTRYIAIEGRFASSLTTCINGTPSVECIEAVEDCELAVFTHDDLLALRNTIAAWPRFYQGYLEKAYVNNTNRLIVLATLDVRARYVRLLAEEPHLAERIPDHVLATYLNMTPETLSRTKRKWREEQAP